MSGIYKIRKDDVDDILSLSPTQEGILFHYIMNPKSKEYFEQLTINLVGKIDWLLFQRAWRYVIQSNEMLRAVFRWDKLKKPLQIILKNADVEIQYLDLIDCKNSQQELKSIKEKDKMKGFNLEETPFRICLCRLSEVEYGMIISSHHILYDGWSTSIIIKEFVNGYSDLRNDKKITSPAKAKYSSFIKWIRQADNTNQDDFWKNYLETYNPIGQFPIKENRRKDVQDKESSQYMSIKRRINQDQSALLNDFILHNRLTMASVMHGAWGILLQSYHNTNDIIFGTVVSGRDCPVEGIEDTVGLFINTVPIRIRGEENQRVLEFLQQIHKNLQEMVSYTRTPLIEIKKHFDGKEMFDTLLVIDNYPLDKMQVYNNFTIESFEMEETSNYDLTLGIVDHGKVELSLSFNKNKFLEETIEGILDHLCNILLEIVAYPNKELKDIVLISEKEKKAILEYFNPDELKNEDSNLVELFEKQVGLNPNQIAIVTEEKEVTYLQLNKVANIIGHKLIDLNVSHKESIVIFMEDNFLSIAAMLGILKTGSNFVFIAPDYPEVRIEAILKELQSTRILIDEALSKESKLYIQRYKDENNSEIINLSNELVRLLEEEKNIHNLNVMIDSQTPAYIVYTSGTTGKPKGIVQSHRSFSQFLKWQSKQFNIVKDTCFFQWASFTYDASYCEIFGSLCFGATLFIAHKLKRFDPLQFLQLSSSHNVTLMQFVPSFFNQVLMAVEEEKKKGRIYPLKDLTYIMLAGERVKPELINKWRELYPENNTRIYNLYGPTETVLATFYEMPESLETDTIPIGKPIDGRKILILDKNRRLCPINVPGEIFIQSDYLTLGYFKNIEETNKKYLKNPLENKEEVNVYWTGDIGCWRSDGNIEFIGRIDNQVKINGRRVEVEEIEYAISQYPSIAECAVVLKEFKEGQQPQLIAYFTEKEKVKLEILKNFLQDTLQQHLLPQKFVLLDKIPRTHSNKFDRNLLVNRMDTYLEVYKEKVYPRNQLEREISSIWKEVLRIDEVAIDDNFFEIGGHSLLAMQVINRLKADYSQNITLMTFFDNPTIEAISGYLQVSDLSEDKIVKINEVLDKVKNMSPRGVNINLKKYKCKEC